MIHSSRTNLHIDIECETETCVHCPFWAMDVAKGIQYCHYMTRDLDTSRTSHPPIPEWCPFLPKDPAVKAYIAFCNEFPEIAPRVTQWQDIGNNELAIEFLDSHGPETWHYRWKPDNKYELVIPSTDE